MNTLFFPKVANQTFYLQFFAEQSFSQNHSPPPQGIKWSAPECGWNMYQYSNFGICVQMIFNITQLWFLKYSFVNWLIYMYLPLLDSTSHSVTKDIKYYWVLKVIFVIVIFVCYEIIIYSIISNKWSIMYSILYVCVVVSF